MTHRRIELEWVIASFLWVLFLKDEDSTQFEVKPN